MWKRLQKWLQSADWNHLVQEVCAVVVGIALGLYGYESKVALLPLKWETNENVAAEVARAKTKAQAESPKPPKQESVPQPTEGKKDTDSDFFGNLFGEGWEESLEKGLKDIEQEITTASGAENWLKYSDEYNKVFEDLGFKGDLQQQVEDLIREGVEPIPKEWTTGKKKYFFILAVILLIISLGIKFSVHFTLLDINRIKSSLFKLRPRLEKRRVDWNGILQDIGTLGISAIGGMYLKPALEEFLKGEAGAYPYPFVIMAIFAGCVFLKLAVASSFLDLSGWVYSRSPLVSTKRFRKFSRAYDWNGLAQQICTIVVSLGIGFYAYESNLALLPIKWKTDENLAQEVAEKKSAPPQKAEPAKTPQETKSESQESGGWDIFGKDVEKELEKLTEEVAVEIVKASGAENLARYSQEYSQVFKDLGIRGRFKEKMEEAIREGVRPVPKKWSDPANRPYVIAAFALFLGCLVLKFLIYFHLVDVNNWMKRRKTATTTGKKKQPVDWDEILGEFATIVLGTMLGLYAEPLLDTLAGKTVSYPYPRLGPSLILVCVILKFLLYLEFIHLGPVSTATGSRPAHAPKKKKSRR